MNFLTCLPFKDVQLSFPLHYQTRTPLITYSLDTISVCPFLKKTSITLLTAHRHVTEYSKGNLKKRFGIHKVLNYKKG